MSGTKRFWQILLSVTGVASAGCLLALFAGRKHEIYSEHISLAAFLRIADSLPYLSRMDEIPLHINQYSPYFFWVLKPIIVGLGFHSYESINILARLYVIGAYVLALWIVWRLLQVYFPTVKQGFVFIFASLWLILIDPGWIGSIRPDLVAIAVECSAFFFLALYLANPKEQTKLKQTRFFLIAILLTGVSIALKLNNVGVFFGALVFLTLEKKFAKACAYVLGTLMVLSVLAYLAYSILGDRFTENMWQSIQNGYLSSLGDIRHVFSRIFGKVVLVNTLWYVFAIFGLREIFRHSPKFGKLVLCCLVSCWASASLGQFKPGAEVNYYLSFFVLSLIPVTVGMKRAGELASRWRIEFQAVTAIVVLCFAAQAVMFSVRVFLDQIPNYPWKKVQNFVEENYPYGYIYADSGAAILHFRERVHFGPSTHLFFDVVDSFDKYKDVFRGQFHTRPYRLAIVTRDHCEYWHPKDRFLFTQMHTLTKFVFKAKKICVFKDYREVG